MSTWDKHFKAQSQMEVDFAPLGKLPRPTPLLPARSSAAIGSDFQDFRKRDMVPSPYEEVGMQRGATRHQDYDPFGSEKLARQSTDFPADAQDFLPAGPARFLKPVSSTDDFSGMGFGGFGSEVGPFGSGKVSRLTVSPLEMVGPPPAYHPPKGPGMQGSIVIGADVAPKAPLWAKLLGGVGVFLGGLMAERYLDKKLSEKPKKRSRR